MKKAVFFAVAVCSLFALTLFGCDEEDTHMVYYNMTGADMGTPPDPEEHKKDEAFQLKDNIGNLEKDAKRFGGWYIFGDVDEDKDPRTVYQAGEYLVMGDEDIVLNVYWEDDESNALVTYTVRYYYENLKEIGYAENTPSAGATQKGKPGTRISESNTKKITGFTFAYADPADFPDSADTVVSLYYTRNTYTLTYNANTPDGAGSVVNLPEEQSFKYEANVTIANEEPTLAGYTFDGWAETAQGERTYAAGGIITKLGDNKTLYAVWKATDTVDVGEDDNLGEDESSE